MKRSAKPRGRSQRGMCGHRSAPGARHGFTIAELVVALLVASLVLIAISTSVSRIGRGREIAQARLAAHQRALDAVESLRRDLSSTIRTGDLFLTRLAIAEGTTRTSLGNVDRSELLLFASRLNPVREITYNGEGIEYETQYRVTDDADGSALWRRRDPVPDDNPEGGGVAEPVSAGVLGVTFEAYDGENWWTTWDSDEDGLPLAVRATVVVTGVADGEDPSTAPELTVTLRTTVPIDRVPSARDEEAERLAREEMMGGAMAEAGAVGGLGAAGAAGAAGAMAVQGAAVQTPEMEAVRLEHKAKMEAQGGGIRTSGPRGGAGSRGGGGGGGGGGSRGGGGGASAR